MSAGQGIVNAPSAGQELEVRIVDPKIKLKAGDIVRAGLKEKLGVDASQSSFALLSVVKQ